MISEDKIKMVKQEFIDMMVKGTEEDGNTSPVFALIIEDPERSKPGLMLFPLPGELMGNKEFKEVLVEKVLPKIADEFVKAQKYIVHTTCFCFEARMWLKSKRVEPGEGSINLEEGEDDSEMVKKMMKEDPNFSDIMFVQFEDKYDREVRFYNITKSTSVGPEGDILTTTKLEEMKDLSFNTNEQDVIMQGIFVNTFKIFWKPD